MGAELEAMDREEIQLDSLHIRRRIKQRLAHPNPMDPAYEEGEDESE